MVMLQGMACPTACPESRLVRRLVQLAQLSQVHLKKGHAPRNGLCYMACPESRLVGRLVQLAVINYFAVDRIHNNVVGMTTGPHAKTQLNSEMPTSHVHTHIIHTSSLHPATWQLFIKLGHQLLNSNRFRS